MPLEATIEFPHADVRELFAQMERGRRELGMSNARVVMQAVKQVSQSLGKSTKVSEEFRPYTEVGKTRKGDKTYYRVETYRAPHSYKGKFKQRFSRNGALRSARVYARDESHLKTFPSVRIKFRGLAKRSWTAFRGAGNAGAIKGINQQTIAAASRHMRFESHLKGDDPHAIITNKLDYISNALEGGESSIETAMERAARGMMHSIDNQLKKKFG